jgi:hypothetical protein
MSNTLTYTIKDKFGRTSTSTVTFNEVSSPVLTITSIEGSGYILSSDGYIDSRYDNKKSYAYECDSTVTLTAYASTGYYLLQWGYYQTEPSMTIRMSRNVNISAIFRTAPMLKLTYFTLHTSPIHSTLHLERTYAAICNSLIPGKKLCSLTYNNHISTFTIAEVVLYVAPADRYSSPTIIKRLNSTCLSAYISENNLNIYIDTNEVIIELFDFISQRTNIGISFEIDIQYSVVDIYEQRLYSNSYYNGYKIPFPISFTTNSTDVYNHYILDVQSYGERILYSNSLYNHYNIWSADISSVLMSRISYTRPRTTSYFRYQTPRIDYHFTYNEVQDRQLYCWIDHDIERLYYTRVWAPGMHVYCYHFTVGSYTAVLNLLNDDKNKPNLLMRVRSICGYGVGIAISESIIPANTTKTFSITEDSIYFVVFTIAFNASTHCEISG